MDPHEKLTRGPAVLAGKDADVGDSLPKDIEVSLAADAQDGVRKMEATTTVWTRTDLIVAYAMIWCLFFIDTTQQSTTGSLTPYVTSSFDQHSLTATTNIVSSIVGGVLKLTLAKVLDIWGRPHGYAISVVLTTMGLIMMAVCRSVETYAAAQVFYWVGYNGLEFTLSIFIADMSALKNRSLMFAYASSPYIITTWIGGPLATAFLDGWGFRWGFGVFSIVTPIVSLPLFGLFMWNQEKARRKGLLPERNSSRSFLQSLRHYCVEFDAIGLLLVSGGLALFLLPFNLYSLQTKGWTSPLIVTMIVIGGMMLIVFALWEKYWAPVKLIPYELLTDRTILGACILSGSLFISFYIWNSYFSSFLQVVNGLTITEASYVVNIYSIGSCLWAIVVGVIIRWSGSFKWLALYFGVPLAAVGVGLMIHFRQPDVNIGYVVMCQLFIAFASGTLVICEQMAVMAAVSHQYIAVILAIEEMFANIGGAIGQTVAGAIWTGIFPTKLAEYLPPESQRNLTKIYGDLATQLSYPVGSPARDAINRAYGDAQKNMLIGATGILAVPFIAVIMWRDIKVKDLRQVKGTVV